MPRELKFRCWDKDIKKMYRFDKLIYCDEYNHLGFHLNPEDRDPDGGSYCNLPGMENFEIMQFTGLKDKNGKEIYEADILVIVSMNKPVVVEWSEGSVCGAADNLVGFYIDGFNFGCEVIGNIHENGDLLGGQ